ncbi:MAG: anti-sigma F factor [Lachnospiraceae bacterium]|nr:anti-sigma F factor [Lachnospiraceae bacterium]
MKIIFESDSRNEAFARTVIAAYVTRLNPTLEELADIKTAVSEAVTNSIIHGYGGREGEVEMECTITGSQVDVIIQDHGIGIADIEQAMEPLYTTKPEWERSGMGFAFMEAFMDDLEVYSEPGKGTRVVMRKKIKQS